MRRLAVVLQIILAVTISSSKASAQTAPGRFVSGPLVWTPTFQIREAGVDSNVFNTPFDTREDVTGGALSQVSSVLTLGLLQAATQASAEYVYFERFKSERGVNGRVNTHMEFPVSRLSPDVTVSWAHVKERATSEIDTRAPRTDLALALGIQAKVTTRTSLVVALGKQSANYQRGFTFRGIEIASQLDRETLQANATVRVNLSPLTALTIDTTASRDSFPLKPDATTDNLRVVTGLEFAPDAVIRGRATVGYHSMQPQHHGVSDATAAAFTGVISTVDLSYTLLGVTRFSGRFLRDSTYSISTSQPFYLSTAGGLEVLQTLFGPVDVTVRGSREKLAYPTTDFEDARTDFVDVIGGGLSLRVTTQATVALIYDDNKRRSTGGRRFEYDRRRIYTTVTYGF